MRREAIVDLPLPEDPTTATILPEGRVRLNFFNIIYCKQFLKIEDTFYFKLNNLTCSGLVG